MSMSFKRILSGAVAFAMSMSMVNVVPLAENVDIYAVGDEAVTIYPTYDIQFRNNNTTDYGTSKSFEVRHGNEAGDNVFLGGLQFDMTGVDTEDIDSVTLEIVTETRDNGGPFLVKPFSDDWSEESGNQYTDKQTEITEALNAEAIAEFNALWGGKKIFEASSVADDKRILSNWTTKIDITDYVSSQIAENDTTISVLITPEELENTKGVSFLSKDVSRDAYGNNASRFDAIIEAFAGEITSESYDLLKPRLVVTYKPEPTPTPEVTPTPEPTPTPEVTSTPEVTQVPEETEKPVETQTPEETVAPAETEEPQAGNLVYPEADIQFRNNNTTDYSTSKGFEVRHANETGDNGFLAGLKFNLSDVNKELLKSVTLEIVTETRDVSGSYLVKPFSDNWSEGNGNKYTDKQTEITEALNADAIAEFNAVWGGKKVFEASTVADDKRVLSNWTSKIDITDYVVSQFEKDDTTISVLITPENLEGTKGVALLGKDISRDSYANDERFDAILEAFANEISESNLDLLKPRLVIDYYTEEELPKPTTITLTGEQSIDIGKITLPAQYTYTAKVFDQYGEEMSNEITWSYNTTVESGKVEFNTETGVMTIPEGAVGQTVTITATCGNASQSVEVLVDELVATSIEIVGADSINNYISDKERQLEYTAKVLDQNGQEMTDKSVEWSFSTDATENAVTFADGIMTVPAGVCDQTITLTAKHGDIEETKTIKVEKTILDFPESFMADRSMKLRGFGNGEDMKVDPAIEEIGMKASAPGVFSFDLSKIINDADNSITEMTLEVYKESGTSIALGLWEYADPEDTVRTDGREWIDTDWTDTANKSDVCNNYSLIFGIDDFGVKHEVMAGNYAEGRDSYIAPIATASVDDNKYSFTVTGDALKSIIAHAKANDGKAELVVTSADLDARSASLKMYMTGALESNEQYMPTLNVKYDLPSTPRKVDIAGNDVLYINNQVDSYTSQYTATVYDQFEELYESQEVEWSADLGETSNVSFDSETGTLTINSNSGEGTVTITATSAYATGTKTVTIKKIPETFVNGSFENTDDSYLADAWTPNVPVYKINFDETDFYYPWNEAKANDGATIFTRTQGYALGKDETGDIRGTSEIDSTLKLAYSTALSDEDAEALMNSATQSMGINNSKTEGFLTVGYEIPYYYMIDYYLSNDSKQILSNQGLYIGLEFRNKADTGFLASVATGDQYMPFTKGKWRTFTGTFTSGTEAQINSQTRVNIGIKGMKGTGYMDYFRLTPKGIDTQNAYEGSNSMLVANTLTWTSDIFSVEQGSYYTYYASVRPESNIVDGQVTYTFMDNNYGVKGEYVVNTETGEWSQADENGWKRIEGQLAVPSGATICQITLSNPSGAGNVWFDGLVFTKTEEAKANEVRITGGSSEVVIPDSGETQYQYTAVVYDQYNNVMSSDVKWDVKRADGSACTGISITSNGILKVSSSAVEGDITVSVSKDDKTASKTVTVIKKGEATEVESTSSYGFNGSFTENDGTYPFGWTNEGKDVVNYTFDSGIESWKSTRTDYGAPLDGELKWGETENHSDKENSGSLLIYNPSYNMPGGQIPNDAQIQGGMPYNFELYFKHENVSDDSLIRANLRYFNSTGGTIAENPNMLRFYYNEYQAEKNEDGWQKWSGSEIVPTNASTVRIDIRYRGGLNNSDGYAWFDDIKISKVTKLDADNMYNGNPSLMLVGYNEDVTTAGKTYGERWISDKLTNISQGNAYEYSAMLQTYGADSGAYLSFIFYDADGNEISTVKSDKVTGTTNSWTELSGSVVAPSGANSVAVAYNLDGKGTAWASGISFNVMSDTNVSGIEISGATSVKIPTSGKKTQTYTVNCVNSEGNVVGAADTVITATSLPTGVTFENGVLTVPSTASTGTVKLSATYGTHTAQLNVSITKSSESSGGSGGGGGGGGTGGGTTVTDTLKPTNTAAPDKTPMGNVEYGTGTIEQGSTTNNNQTSQVPSLLQSPGVNYFTGGDKNVIFEDINDVPWAKSSIEALYRAGIVSGKAEKIYAPHDNVTRAEFVTMLVKTFKLTSDNKTNNFTDVNEGDWYYDSVNIAVGNGIISGISEDYFGASEKITRQDIAVMSIRLWDAIGKQMTGNYKVSFTDLDEISEYALDAVTLMAEAGVVSGMETGEFAPKANATRAQAAVIIYRLAVKYDE